MNGNTSHIIIFGMEETPKLPRHWSVWKATIGKYWMAGAFSSMCVEFKLMSNDVESSGR